MQAFQKVLDEDGEFRVVGRVKMRGEVRKDERELVVYVRK